MSVYTAGQDIVRLYALQVVIAGVGAKESPLSELIGYLPNSDCRYGGRVSGLAHSQQMRCCLACESAEGTVQY